MKTLDLPDPLTLDDIMAVAMDDRDAGFCMACGAQAEGCEPDARRYTCEACGEPEVYGAEELVIMLA